tara:strand:+ start:153 stop:497 length:345 start_codon:yes stop_codon:yes gene_type:complete
VRLYIIEKRESIVHTAKDHVEQSEWISEIDRVANELNLGVRAKSYAVEIYLSDIPEMERSKPAAIATGIYVGSLIAGEERSQQEIADKTGVSRLTIQGRWKDTLKIAGFDPPSW